MEKVNDTANRFCRILLDVLMAHGVRDVVCSPGSRNAPLLIAVAAREELRAHVVVDERSAAFMALGISQVSQSPVALVCTSGTALLNYAPAVAEAFYQGVPLIVVSADRPEQWIDQDDSQTIRQNGALANFVKRSYDLPAIADPDPEMCWFADRVANDAMIEALSGRPGPVHLNVRLAPPLGSRMAHDAEKSRKISLVAGESLPSREVMERLAADVFARKTLVVAGFMPPDSKLNRAMNMLNSMEGVVVIAETISNLHLPPECYCVDSLLASLKDKDLPDMRPELVISVGGAIVSRKIKEFLRRCEGMEHWAVGFQHTTVDCFQSLSLRIEADTADFMTHLAGRMRKLIRRGLVSSEAVKNFKESWKGWGRIALKETLGKAGEAEWSDLKAYSMILDSIPVSSNLFLSNGTSVRYAQILSRRIPHATFCNRGVSGIDGSTSTAIGGALAYKGGLTFLLTGDMSFAYDIGALQLRRVPDTMRIIVVNNGGGGIFRFIPSTSGIEPKDMRERFFCADPGLDIGDIAVAFGWRYLRADSPETLLEALERLTEPDPGKCVLEVVTPGELSAHILTRLLT